MPPPPITVALSAPETPSPRLAQSSESVSAKEALAEKGILHVNYNYQSGQYIRRVRATVNNPWGLWRALLPLQAPLGAKGAYGLIGDDRLLGQSPGFGLIQLGGIARKYITFESVYVVQPAGFRRIGVQKGVFTNVDEMNDVTLGWVFFDLRPKFEADLKQMLDL
jgi:hypothetical protein